MQKENQRDVLLNIIFSPLRQVSFLSEKSGDRSERKDDKMTDGHPCAGPKGGSAVTSQWGGPRHRRVLAVSTVGWDGADIPIHRLLGWDPDLLCLMIKSVWWIWLCAHKEGLKLSHLQTCFVFSGYWLLIFLKCQVTSRHRRALSSYMKCWVCNEQYKA